MGGHLWDREREQQLAEMIERRFSSTQVAKMWGITRNSVLGKADRLGLHFVSSNGVHAVQAKRLKASSPRVQAKKEKAVIVAKRKILPKPPKPVVAMPDPNEYFKRMPDYTGRRGVRNAIRRLKSSDCRWPYGDPKDANFHFCCRMAAVHDTPRYCAYHKALAAK